MKVGDLVRLKTDEWDAKLYNHLPATGIIVWKHPRNDLYIRLLGMQVEVLTRYYEVISESR